MKCKAAELFVECMLAVCLDMLARVYLFGKVIGILVVIYGSWYNCVYYKDKECLSDMRIHSIYEVHNLKEDQHPPLVIQ